jgi:hypothetical protein
MIPQPNVIALPRQLGLAVALQADPPAMNLLQGKVRS